MRKITTMLGIAGILATGAFADGKSIAKKLGLHAGDKASKQWERMLSSADKLKEVGADKLSDGEKNELKAYLVGNAADSDHPSVPGQ